MNTAASGITGTIKDNSPATNKGTENIVEKTLDATAHVITTAVKDTAKVGGEIGNAATGLVKGAIEDVGEVGVKAERATGAVAVGAVKAVGEVGASTVDAVRHTVTKPANNDKAQMPMSKN